MNSEPPKVTILTPTGCLGNGPLDEVAFHEGMRHSPDAIAMDAGSLDPGPYYLGTGTPHVSRAQAKRDLLTILPAARQHRIPVIIGSAGGSGTRTGVEWTLELIREVSKEQELDLRVAAIYSDVEKDHLRDLAREGRVQGLGWDRELTDDAIAASSNIVGVMGVEPFLRALDEEPDVVLAGRACDDAVVAALPVRLGFDKGLALHMGSILECGGLAAEWKPDQLRVLSTNNSSVVGTLDHTGFTIRPCNPGQRATLGTVVGHSLYERRDPYLIQDPGGVLDLTGCEFQQVDDETVRVGGSRFVPDAEYTIKLEGARPIGYRSVSIFGIRDPILVREIDQVLATVKEKASARLADLAVDVQLNFVVYGRDGVMGGWEIETQSRAHELGILMDVVASTQEAAHDACELVRAILLFQPYRGRLSTAGNLAFPLNPRVLDAGQMFEISVHHVVPVDDPCAMFPMRMVQVSRGKLS